MVACGLEVTKPLSEPMQRYCWLDPGNKLQWILIKVTHLIHQGIRVWLLKPPPPPQYSSAELYVINLDATFGRWGRSGDCQVDGGVPVFVNSTAIGAAPGALTVAAGAYPSTLIFTVSLPPAALCIYTWYAIASSITCLDILLNGLYW